MNFHAKDPIGFSTTTDGESPFFLTYYTDNSGLPLFVVPPGIPTGGDDIPNSGITLPDGVYIVYSSGSDVNAPDIHANRTISSLPGGHFVFDSLHVSGSDVYIFGVGHYRTSDIYLCRTPISSFASGVGTQYFAGMLNSQPMWTTSGAVSVVQDNPLNGPAWPNDSPTAGKMSVTYSNDLNLWLMTYEGGRQSKATTGIYFTYASSPWGPWTAPQLIFNDMREHGRGVFIHDPSIVPDPPGDGLNGPVAGTNDPYTTAGDVSGPLMIERFVRVVGDTLRIYCVMSTWNPYTVVKMRSTFTITGERRRAAKH